MADVDKTGDMRRRARRGEPIAAIARAVGVSEPTARKYARMDDLSPEPPRRRKPESEVLAPYEGTTGSLARRRPRELAQAAPHGREGVCEALRRAGLRRLLLNRAALRQAQARGDGQGA